MKTRFLAAVFAIDVATAQSLPRPEAAAANAALAKAGQFEAAYDWAHAREVYDELLARHQGHAEAKAGKDRVTAVLVAERQFEKCIAEAEHLEEQAKFQRAVRVFNQAMVVMPSYVSSDRVRELRARLMAQNTPVELTLKSDGKTWVSIEHFLPPRKLQTEPIKILPGNYRAIGRRSGYRDAEQTLIVRGGTPKVVVIECNEPLTAPVPSDDQEQVLFQREYQTALAASRAADQQAKAQFDEELETIRRTHLPK